MTVRSFILAIILFGAVGTGAELVLLGHYEDWQQWIPLVVLAVATIGGGWVFARPSAGGVRAVRALGFVFLLTGLAGVGLHFRGNVEFELEMRPALRGFALVWEALTGATPALAPGSMVLLGLLGLAFGLRHPLLSGPAASDADA